MQLKYSKVVKIALSFNRIWSKEEACLNIHGCLMQSLHETGLESGVDLILLPHACVGLCSNCPDFAFTYSNQDRARNKENRFYILILKGYITCSSHQLELVISLPLSWLIKMSEFF
jgi:hypothetical protein